MACERNRLSSNRFRRNKCVQFNCVCSGVCPCEPLPVRMCVLFCVVSARTVARGGACVLLVGTAVELATAREEGSHDVRYLGIT